MQGRNVFSVLRERVNDGALAKLASCRHAGAWKPAGTGPMLRRIIADVIEQIRRGAIVTAWSEETRMEILGLRGRRYSGYRFESTEEPHWDFFRGFADGGVNESTVGRSLFGLPGWLRDVGRIGLVDCYILDMTNAHPAIQHRRHQDLGALHR